MKLKVNLNTYYLKITTKAINERLILKSRFAVKVGSLLSSPGQVLLYHILGIYRNVLKNF
ncbi:hypothetical protein PSN45_004766 [Yamadazyma tenuis]|uniref:uncharacterized protein n=1 Tax=Candida tenuis TaxID=2315449 RepID=UPI0027A58DD9|nr:hypothetical protein PSN45_004766 [Yamadazyma tenuis]